MEDIITISTLPLKNNQSEKLLFRYYQDLPAGSIVEVGVREGNLEEYKADSCYEFEVDFFGERKKLYLENKKPLGYNEEFELHMFEFLLRGIEDLESGE